MQVQYPGRPQRQPCALRGAWSALYMSGRGSPYAGIFRSRSSRTGAAHACTRAPGARARRPPNAAGCLVWSWAGGATRSTQWHLHLHQGARSPQLRARAQQKPGRGRGPGPDPASRRVSRSRAGGRRGREGTAVLENGARAAPARRAPPRWTCDRHRAGAGLLRIPTLTRMRARASSQPELRAASERYCCCY